MAPSFSPLCVVLRRHCRQAETQSAEMQGVRKIARSGSLKLEEWRGKERKYEAEKEPAELQGTISL